MQFKHGGTGKLVAGLLEISERTTDQGNVFNVKVIVRLLGRAVYGGEKYECPPRTIDCDPKR